jgi:two-component system, NarL family, response regulator
MYAGSTQSDPELDAGLSQRQACIRIMIADDHPVVCFGLRGIIQTQPDMSVVAEAKNGKEAVTLFRQHRPDVTLMDLRMPEMGGVEAIRLIRQEHPNSSVIVLTTYHGDDEIRKALTAGARAYVLKGMSHVKLLDAIRTVHAGRQYLPQLVLESLRAQPPGSALSPRELEILRLIVKGLNNHEIAVALNISHGTVKWHVNMILCRLDVRDRTQAAMAAINRGIIEGS